jgi:hypothetical protein
MKNSPSWRGRNVSEAVAIQKKLSFSMDCRALRARNDEKNGAHNDEKKMALAMAKKNGTRNEKK